MFNLALRFSEYIYVLGHKCVEENIWTKGGWRDGRLEKAA
jgi:hypothetical protein